MKNNQGYYHWIHSLNQASKQVQHNHAKLLHEAKYNATVSGESGLKQGGTRIRGNPTAGVVGSGPEEHAGDLAAGIAGMLKKSNEGSPRPLRLGGKTNIKNLADLGREISNLGGVGFDDEDFEDLGDEKGGPGTRLNPEHLATIAQMSREKAASTPHRTASTEDATRSGAQSRAKSAEVARATFARPSYPTGFKNPLGAQARIEAGAGVAGDVELAARDAKPTSADLDGNGTVGDAGDVALDASDNSMDGQYAGMSANEITRRANAALPERSMKAEPTAHERAYRQAALGVARKGGSREAMKAAGRSAWQASMNPESTPAAPAPVAQTAASSESGEKPVLRGRAAQIALAQKKGKRLSESVSDIINRMING